MVSYITPPSLLRNTISGSSSVKITTDKNKKVKKNSLAQVCMLKKHSILHSYSLTSTNILVEVWGLTKDCINEHVPVHFCPDCSSAWPGFLYVRMARSRIACVAQNEDTLKLGLRCRRCLQWTSTRTGRLCIPGRRDLWHWNRIEMREQIPALQVRWTVRLRRRRQ